MASTRVLRPIGGEKPRNLQAWFPRDRTQTDLPQDNTFEVGLTFAGGQSAGCYLAGVLDFLFEALDSWEQARLAEPGKYPNHQVRIKIICGASAGGLNTALAAIAGRYRFQPARHTRFEDGDRNLGSPFYRAWVRDVDIRHLLTTDDMGSSGSFSVLNNRYLDEKVASYLDFKGEAPTKREWFDDPLPIVVIVSNVDGVPFRIKFRTEDDNDASANAYWMTLHGDRLGFRRPMAGDTPEPSKPDSDALSLDNSSLAPDWQRLGQAVLATIAFPLALRERIIGRPTTDYDYRFVYPSDPGGPVHAPPFPGEAEQQRSFVTIDGGVTDNEPFEIAHTALAGTDGRNVREGDKAKRAVILTAPFVSPKPVQYGVPNTPLPTLFGKIWSALIAQSRFKLMDVSLAANADIYSRFMIAPVRVQQPSGQKIRGDAALASHPLTSFFGRAQLGARQHPVRQLARRGAGRPELQEPVAVRQRLPPDHPADRHGRAAAGDLSLAGRPVRRLCGDRERHQTARRCDLSAGPRPRPGSHGQERRRTRAREAGRGRLLVAQRARQGVGRAAGDDRRGTRADR